MRNLIKFLLLVSFSVSASAGWLTPDAYDKKYVANVLERSVFYAPMYGGLYKQRWELAVKEDPNVRAVAIHLHGCGGLGMLEGGVASFYVQRLGIAVITPDFVARPGNKTGCPGDESASMLRGGEQRFKEGVYTARNSERMDARTDDVEALVAYVKKLTNKPIFISGHSEGARTSYHFDKVDPQIVGVMLHNQSCTASYSQIWRLPTSYKTWQVIENNDPWTDGATDCAFHFKGADAANITLLRQSGDNHRPLNNDEAKFSLKKWVDGILGGPYKMLPFHNEALLPELQKNYQVKSIDK